MTAPRRSLRHVSALLASALGAGGLLIFAPTMAMAQASGAPCPKAGVVETATSVTPVTKANYASAETEVILADYVRKIAKGT